MFFKNNRAVNRCANRGFTLVELIVVVAIVVLITTLTLVGHANFRGSILLSNLSYDVALSVRQAQVFGLGVREATIAGSDFDTGYGIRFTSATPDSYLLFADLNRNLRYDGSNELVQSFTIQRGYAISNVCVSNNQETCSLSHIDIVFDRPEPDALIRGSNGVTYSSARIEISSPQETKRAVAVSETGQISVSKEIIAEGGSTSSSASGGSSSSTSGSSSSSSSGGGSPVWTGPLGTHCGWQSNVWLNPSQVGQSCSPSGETRYIFHKPPPESYGCSNGINWGREEYVCQ